MRLRRLLVLLAATLLLVSGCGGDNPESKPTPKPSSTTSGSPTPPAMPAAAKQKTKRGARAFARHYVDVLNFATITGETSSLDALSGPRCRACARVVDQIRSVYDAGGAITSKGWKIKRLVVVGNRPERPYIDLLVHQAPQRVRKSADAKVETFPGGEQPMTMLLNAGPEGWRVADLRIVT